MLVRLYIGAFVLPIVCCSDECLSIFRKIALNGELSDINAFRSSGTDVMKCAVGCSLDQFFYLSDDGACHCTNIQKPRTKEYPIFALSSWPKRLQSGGHAASTVNDVAALSNDTALRTMHVTATKKPANVKRRSTKPPRVGVIGDGLLSGGSSTAPLKKTMKGPPLARLPPKPPLTGVYTPEKPQVQPPMRTMKESPWARPPPKSPRTGVLVSDKPQRTKKRPPKFQREGLRFPKRQPPKKKLPRKPVQKRPNPSRKQPPSCRRGYGLFTFKGKPEQYLCLRLHNSVGRFQSWHSAERTCRSEGGRLAVGNTRVRMKIIQQRLKSKSFLGAIQGLVKKRVWIGLRGNRWIDGSEKTYTKFASKKKENGGPNKCVSVEMKGKILWQYQDCNTPNFFICEMV